MDESVQPDWLTCPALDVISIHAYGTGDYSTSSIQTYVSRAQAAGKKLIMEEWYVLRLALMEIIQVIGLLTTGEHATSLRRTMIVPLVAFSRPPPVIITSRRGQVRSQPLAFLGFIGKCSQMPILM
jgi:hypothetical protein